MGTSESNWTGLAGSAHSSEELSEQQQDRANDEEEEEELEVVAINNMPPGLRRSLYESQLRRPREVEINELNFNAEVLFAKKELEIMLDSCTRYGTSGHGSGPFSPSNGVSLYHLLEHGFCWARWRRMNTL